MTEPANDAFQWRQANPAFIAIQFFRSIRGLFVPIVFILVSRGFNGGFSADGVFIGIGLAGALIVAMTSVASWQFLRFGVSDRQLKVKSGIINKQERSVSFERIQSVDIEEAPLDRIFGVVRVRVETAAGGGSKDADFRIEALKRDDAEALRSYLIRSRQELRAGHAPQAMDADESAQPVVPITTSEGTLVRALSTRELLIAGATSGRIGPAAAILGFFAQFADDVIPNSWWERLPWENVSDIATSVQAIALVVFVIGLVAWMLSVFSTVLSFGGFEIRRIEDQLVIQYGLLDRRRLTIPVQRMQAIRVVEGMLRQPFGLAEVRFESAGYSTESAANGVLFPLLRMSDVSSFLDVVVPEFAVEAAGSRLRSLPPRSLTRYIVPGTLSMLILGAIVAGVTWLITDEIEPWSLAVFALAPLVALYSLFEYRDAGWLIDGGNLVVRRRNGGRETVTTRIRRLQHRRLLSNPFQRRAHLATFRAAVASGGEGGRFEIAHLDRDDGDYLLAVLGPRG
jgi:putative membrane protein